MTLECLESQETFRDFLGLYLSTPRHELDIFTDNYSSTEVEDLLINKKTLYLTNGVKFIYFENILISTSIHYSMHNLIKRRWIFMYYD